MSSAMTTLEKPRVVDVILPVFTGKWIDGKFRYERSVGTCFTIGGRGFALTAAHVVEQMQEDGREGIVAANLPGGGWFPIRILASEAHASEDVALIQLEKIPMGSWLKINTSYQNHPADWYTFGYPIAVAEFGKDWLGDPGDDPDLVYTAGYIKRRFDRELPFSIFRGKAHYELSAIAGSGCSGAPVIIKRPGESTWEVIGLYTGEATDPYPLGYAARMDALADWVPTLLGGPLKAEFRRG